MGLLETPLESPPSHYRGGGTGGGVLLSPRVWRGCHCGRGILAIEITCLTILPPQNRRSKQHTHTEQANIEIILFEANIKILKMSNNDIHDPLDHTRLSHLPLACCNTIPVQCMQITPQAPQEDQVNLQI